MKAVTLAGALTLVLFAVPAFAQVKPPVQPPPAQKPAPPAQPAPQQPTPPPPFPEGAKMAFIDIQRIASESKEGQTSTQKVQALEQKKLNDLNEKNKQLTAAQQKAQSGSLLSDEARAQLQKEIDRLNLEIQRSQQDAQAEVDELRNALQRDFQRKLMPIIEMLAKEKALQFLFSADAGIVWADRALDLTSEIIKRFDAAVASGVVKAPEPSPSARQ
jgi:outer membrane protein